MSGRKPKPTKHLSLRLTDDERTRLFADAGRTPVSAYIRTRLFGADARERAIRIPAPVEADLARLLAVLGQSEIAVNLRELAEAARVGALPVTPETEHAIRSACDTVERIRSDLLKALGLRQGRYD